MPDYVEDLLNSKRLSEAGYFDTVIVEQMMKKIKEKPENAGYKADSSFLFILTTMLLDEIFIKNYQDNFDPGIHVHWVEGVY